jgi:hypothetical protein
MDEQLQLIETVDELNKHKGEILLFYYYWNKTDKPWFMWMGKFLEISEIKSRTRDKSIKGKYLCVEKQMTIGDCYGFNIHKKVPYELIGAGCDAQSYIRIPTKEELKTYMNFFRHIRIFGR